MVPQILCLRTLSRLAFQNSRVSGMTVQVKGPASLCQGLLHQRHPVPVTQAFRSKSPYRTVFSASRRPQRSNPGNGFLSSLDKIPQNTVFYGIIGLNGAVFAMWFLAKEKYKQEGDLSSLIWMQQNFTDSWQNLASGRFWTPVSACFSHRDISHILFNGFTFFFMGPPVLALLGSRQFIFLYLGGGLVSSFTSILYSRLGGHRDMDYASHGASGAIYSMVSLLACVAPKMTFHLYGIIPVPAWLAITGLFGYDFYSTMLHKTGTTDTVGHIGGITAGVGYFILRRIRVL